MYMVKSDASHLVPLSSKLLQGNFGFGHVRHKYDNKVSPEYQAQDCRTCNTERSFVVLAYSMQMFSLVLRTLF